MDVPKLPIAQSKAPGNLFEPAALDMIAAHCRGNRRKIINCATLLLEEAYFRQEKTITAQIMLECDLISPADIP